MADQFRPSESFKERARSAFLAEARCLYGRGWFYHARFAAAAAILGGLFIWLALGGPSAQRTAPVRPEAPGSAPDFANVRAAIPPSAPEWETKDARVIADAGALWRWPEDRTIVLEQGRIYLDVEPADRPFKVETRKGDVIVRGTRLLVDASGEVVRVDVGSGDVELSSGAGAVTLEPGEEGVAGEGMGPEKRAARRFSYLADFVAERYERAEGATSSEGFSYGLARLPNSAQKPTPLVVTRYHLDIHIEDGMARTTIDQVFFNPLGSRIEGTFLFPLPPDASISRLAMYVDGKLMEGGMAERSYASEVYEGIVRKMQDPAILEWMEGSTFRLRIFPFEPGSERRIILSYQQPLETLYEVDRYRFPILAPKEPWEEFSIHVLVKGGAEFAVKTPTYPLKKVGAEAATSEFAFEERQARPAKDVLIELRNEKRPELDFASHEADGERFICIRAHPEVAGEVYRGPRRALLLLDRSGNASPSEQRAQNRVAARILRALDRTDSIAVMTYSTEARAWGKGFAPRTKENVAEAIDFAAAERFYGAGDLAKAFDEARKLFGEPREGDAIFYVGDGIDTISCRQAEQLAVILPEKIRFFAMPVTRSYDRRLLGALADRSGGRVVAVSPDERIGWRAFDLVSALRTPEWKGLSWELLDAERKPIRGSLHADKPNLRHGEVLSIAGRIEGSAWPRFLRLQGKEIALPERRADRLWVPRLWAKMHIDSLERESAAEHREEIVRLGKQYYVMNPFTALLVLENDAMYEQYKVDRGRKDHWALYNAPAEWRGKTRHVTTWHRGEFQLGATPGGVPVFLDNVWGESGLGTGVPLIIRDLNQWGMTGQNLWWDANGAAPLVIDLGTRFDNFSNVLFYSSGSRFSIVTPAVRFADTFGDYIPVQGWSYGVPLFSTPFATAGVDPTVDAFHGVININTATREVLAAVSDGLSGRRPFAFVSDSPSLRRETQLLEKTLRGDPVLEPPSDIFAFPSSEHWDIVRQRPEIGRAAEEGSPEVRAIRRLLQTTKVMLDFDGRPLREVVDSLEVAGQVDIQHDKEVDVNEVKVTLQLTEPVFLQQALDLIMVNTGLLYTIRKDAIVISTPEKARDELKTQLIEKALRRDAELCVTTGDQRIVAFSTGERIIIEGERAVYLKGASASLRDPLFDAIVAGDPGLLGAWSSVPWFLMPLEVLTGGAEVREERFDAKTVVAIDRGGFTFIEIVFNGTTPVELRLVLRDNAVLQRIVYTAWEKVGDRQLPTRGELFGIEGKRLSDISYGYGAIDQTDRSLLAKFVETTLDARNAAMVSALWHFRRGDRAELERAFKQGADSAVDCADLRKVARLAAIRWRTEPVIEAPPLHPASPEVRRWLPPDPLPLGVWFHAAVQRGDIAALAAVIRMMDNAQDRIDHLEYLLANGPAALQGLVDLWIGEIAAAEGWHLKAYGALSRALTWAPLRDNIGLLDRLTELALSIQEPEKAFERAERASEVAEEQFGESARGPRFARLCEIAQKRPEFWKARGAELLERWAAAAPRDPEPYARLSAFHAEAGNRSLAVRCATQKIELAQTKAAYTEVAAELDKLGAQAEAASCRAIAELLKQ